MSQGEKPSLEVPRYKSQLDDRKGGILGLLANENCASQPDDRATQVVWPFQQKPRWLCSLMKLSQPLGEAASL